MSTENVRFFWRLPLVIRWIACAADIKVEIELPASTSYLIGKIKTKKNIFLYWALLGEEGGGAYSHFYRGQDHFKTFQYYYETKFVVLAETAKVSLDGAKSAHSNLMYITYSLFHYFLCCFSRTT